VFAPDHHLTLRDRFKHRSLLDSLVDPHNGGGAGRSVGEHQHGRTIEPRVGHAVDDGGHARAKGRDACTGPPRDLCLRGCHESRARLRLGQDKPGAMRISGDDDVRAVAPTGHAKEVPETVIGQKHTNAVGWVVGVRR
jgi:hypothetical protein